MVNGIIHNLDNGPSQRSKFDGPSIVKEFFFVTCWDWLLGGEERWVEAWRWGTATGKSSSTVHPRSG